MPKSELASREVFIDFGIRKPHAVLFGRSRNVVFVDDLRTLKLHRYKVYLEEGFPSRVLYDVLSENEVFLVDGRAVKSARAALGITKTDSNDALVIRNLARNQPHLFRPVTVEEAADIQDRRDYRYYCKLTDLIVSLKNRQRGFLLEFGEPLPFVTSILLALAAEKRKASKFFEKFKGIAGTVGIRGVGPRYLAGILLVAHPRRFPSLTRYLRYCGLKASSIESKKYSRDARSLYHQLAREVVMKKDVTYYRFYRKLKSDLRARFPDCRGAWVEAKAKNRLATFLAKEMYFRFSGKEVSERTSRLGRVPLASPALSP